MKKLLLILLFFCSLLLQAQNIYVPKGTIPGIPYGFVYNIPDTSAHKLLISLHGLGEKGNGKDQLYLVERVGVAKQVKAGTFKRKEFITVSPQFETDGGYYHETLHVFIQKMCAKFNVPPDQVYIMGISMGAISIFKYMLYLKINNAKFSTKIHPASIVCIAGENTSFTRAGEFTDTKLWVLYGEYDTTTKVLQGKYWVDYYNLAGPPTPARLTIYPFEKHTSYVFDKSFQQDEIYNWMLKN
jgi:predicted peptidase